MTKPRVLAVVTLFPWPENHGDAVRRLMVLRAVSSKTSLTVFAVRRPTTSRADEEALSRSIPDAVVKVFDLDAWSQRDGLHRVTRAMLATIGGTPAWTFKQFSSSLALTLKRVSDDTFDTVILLGEPAGLYARAASGQRNIIWDKSNVLGASVAARLKESRGAGKAKSLIELVTAVRFERRVLHRVSTVWLTSDSELRRFARLYRPALQTTQLATLQTAVNIPQLTAAINTNSRVMAWMSTFNYKPNWEGLVRVLEANALWLRSHGWQVRIVGAGATPAQIAVLRTYKDVVSYVGYASDLREALTGVACAVVPIWSGAGIKLKTLTLAALGVPLIATPVALEGVPTSIAMGLLQSAYDLPAVLAAFDPASAHDHARRARDLLFEHFSAEAFYERAAQLLAT